MGIGQLFDDGDPKNESCLERNQRVILSAFMFLLTLASWCLFFMYFCDAKGDDYLEGYCEGMTWDEALYLGVVSVTGVGFGDIVPHTGGGRLFSVFGSLIGVATYLNLLEAIAEKMRCNRHW